LSERGDLATADTDGGTLSIMSRDHQKPAAWRKSNRCVADNHCVEIAEFTGGFGIRNSQHEMSLIFDAIAWANFVEALKQGDFDCQ
jgi:hypothetical protein